MSNRQKPPSYRCQKRPAGDLAFVELGGRRIYLGSYGSPESKAEYRKRLVEWEISGERHPVPANDLTVVELCDAHHAHALKYYPEGNRELAAFKAITGAMVRLYGKERVAEFGPLRFKAVRAELMATPDKRRKDGKQKRSRQYVNKLCRLLKQIIKWGVSEEMIPASVWHALQTVPGLTRGRTELPETPGVTVVSDEVINATCEHLTPTLRAMVRLQQYTGMRPGEVCCIRTCDLDTPEDPGKAWTFQPPSHKTAWRGKGRTIFIGPKARAILKPLLRPSLEEYIFSPARSEQERRDAMHEKRTTPKGQGNEPGTNRKRKPLKTPGEKYTTDTYARAIRYACVAAFGDNQAMYWSPNQLRHSFATSVRREYGLEAAQVLLGHSKADVTQIYAERDLEKAVTVIAKIG